MSFFLITTITASATLVLGLGFLLKGKFMLGQWGLDAPPAAAILSRRIGAVYLGLALLAFMIRNSAQSDDIAAVSAGFALATALLACLGLLDLISGRAGKGILVSVVVETLLTAGFVSAIWS